MRRTLVPLSLVRASLVASLGLALLTLTACQQGHGGGGGSGARPAPDLVGAFARTYGARVAEAFPAAQRAGVAQCVGRAMATGIPLKDQFLIYDAIESGQSTSASQTALHRWVGGPVLHGPMRGGYSNKLTYADGTTVTGDPATERIEGNLQQTCAPYKDRLMKSGYLAAPSGGAPSGGYSKGK
jgi:hypothetical protein